jgi:hypothetical protein
MTMLPPHPPRRGARLQKRGLRHQRQQHGGQHGGLVRQRQRLRGRMAQSPPSPPRHGELSASILWNISRSTH